MADTRRAVTALRRLVDAKRALWVAWDDFEAAIGHKVCKRTEPDADRALSNLVISGEKRITQAHVKHLREAIAWEVLGCAQPEVQALTDAAVAAVQVAVTAAASVRDGSRRRSLDVEGSLDGDGILSGIAQAEADEDETADDNL